MKKLLTEWRKFLKEEDWRDTSWADDDHKVTIGDVDEYLGEKTIEVGVQELLKQIPELELEPHRIAKASLEFPIIVVRSGGQYRSVLDGNHRLAKAAKEGHETIKARILDLDAADIPEHWKELFRAEEEEYVPKGDHMEIPAKYLASHMGEYRTEPFWINFRKKTDEEKLAWAEQVDISEPVEITVFKDGQFMHGDGHHRVKAATILGKEVPIIITRNHLKDKSGEDVWEEWLRLVQSGNHPADLNPDKYNINSVEEIGLLAAKKR
jgi:hypothetical protein